MNEKKIADSVAAMKLAERVRKFAKLNAWKMHKAMKKKSVQAYISLEESAKRITLTDFYHLERIYVEAGGTKEEFDRMARECAAKEKS